MVSETTMRCQLMLSSLAILINANATAKTACDV
jgi:hypothetical protein